MTDDNDNDLRNDLGALEQEQFENRVELWREIINADGTPTGRRIYRGSFVAPPGWEPPTPEQLLAATKKGSNE